MSLNFYKTWFPVGLRLWLNIPICFSYLRNVWLVNSCLLTPSGSTLRWNTLQTDTSVTRCSAPRSRPPHPSARRWWPFRTARGAATSQRFTSSHGTGRYTSKAQPSCTPSTPGIHTAPRWTTTATETQPGADGLCPRSGWSPPRTPVHASFTQKTSERHTWEACYPSQYSKTTVRVHGLKPWFNDGCSVRVIWFFCIQWRWYLMVEISWSSVCVCGLYMCFTCQWCIYVHLEIFVFHFNMQWGGGKSIWGKTVSSVCWFRGLQDSWKICRFTQNSKESQLKIPQIKSQSFY